MLAVGALAAGGCAADRAAAAEDEPAVAAVIKGLNNTFFQSMEQGIQDQAQQLGTRSRSRPRQTRWTPPARPTG